MVEIWKSIKGYEGIYEASNLGRIRRLFKGTRGTTERIVKGQVSPFGYHRVQLTVRGKIKYLFAHRLVAQTFIPNPEDKPEVNHIDGNKLNNNVVNLEWCTKSENMKHAINTGLYKPNVESARISANKARLTKVSQFDLKGNFVRNYDSVKEAAESMGVNQSNISQNLRGKNKSASGYVWKYTSPEEAIKIVTGG